MSEPVGDERRLWTLEEARAFLPRLRVLLGAIRGRVELATRARSNGHASAVYAEDDPEPAAAEGEEVASAEVDASSAVEELEERGIVLRDVERGLVDFPARHPGGRIVLLCWLSGEPDIRWWHLPEEGFAGRKPLPLPPEI